MYKNNIKIRIVSLVVILLAVVIYFAFFGTQNKGYSVVYFSSGEMYVGRLSTFPRFTLTDGYLVQATLDPADQTKKNFQLSPISDALWATKRLHLNKNQVLFYGPLEESSKIGETLLKTNKK